MAIRAYELALCDLGEDNSFAAMPLKYERAHFGDFP
jgi:hypothetical protein